VIEKVVAHLAEPKPVEADRLSEHEREVLALLAQGAANARESRRASSSAGRRTAL